MTLENSTLPKIRELIAEEIPSNLSLDRVTFEGPDLVIYTSTPGQFVNKKGLIGNLAKLVQKRITVRPSPGTQMNAANAEMVITEMVPDEAGINNINFYSTTGEALIEAEKPGLVIGPGGETFREITEKTAWAPEVTRTPPIQSSTVDNIRNYLKQERADRQEFLEQVGSQIYREPTSDEEWVRITTLGCCREVGRASFILHTPESRVLIDCGDKPGAEGEVPYLHALEANPISDIDAVVLTHAHLDHSALLPLLFKYGYDGPIYTTAPTRDLIGLLQLDYLNVASKEGRTPPYESELVREELKHTITLRYGRVTDIAPDIQLTLHNAGHILGSSVAHFHIGNGLHNVVFTGDIHFTETRLFNGAVNSFPRAETVVMESTYGRQNDYQTDQADSEQALIRIIQETYEKGGKVIIPSFAVGRSQEVMLVLEEAMREGMIPTQPVYLDGMIREATAIHTTYPNFLRDGLRDRILHAQENPFLQDQFKQVDGGREMRERIASDGPCIILSTSGMVTGGPIMSWLDLLGPDAASTLVFVGYQAQGTLGNRIQSGLKDVPIESREGDINRLTLQLRVESVDGFSGHADRAGLENFVKTMDPRPSEILCVHGDETATNQLSSGLYQNFNIRTYAPKNLETFRVQ